MPDASAEVRSTQAQGPAYRPTYPHQCGSASVRDSSWVASVVIAILFQASRADDGLRQAWRRRIWKAVAMTLSLFLARE